MFLAQRSAIAWAETPWTAATVTPSVVEHPMNILIVEDNEDNRRLLLKRLRGLGHLLREAASGQAALEAIRQDVPELILLDLQLPDMPGELLARQLRADLRLQRTVLIACTAFAMPQDKERALAAGCDGYLSKPLDLRRIAEQLEEIVHEAQR